MQQATNEQAAEQLAARLFYLTQQENAIKEKKDEVKAALNELHASNKIPTKSDMEVLFSDGTFRKLRLQQVKTGTYFKAGDDHKDSYSSDSHKLQARYLKEGKAEMAEKASTWKVQEVKS